MTAESNKRVTKNERRQQAREQARIAREQEKKREKRNRLFLQGGIVLGVIAILAIVGVVIAQSVKPAGPGPANMASGGAVFTEDLEVVPTPALQSDEERTFPEVDRENRIDVSVYVDYMCPGCGSFEQQYGTMLENYVGAGDFDLRIYPLDFLNGSSLGSKYSTRAANLFGCVVDQQPEHAFAVHNRLLSADVQPAQGTTGLTDEQLIEQAEAAGATADTELKRCVKDVRFGSFFSGNTKVATEVGLLGLAKGTQLADSSGEPQPADGPQRLISTPTIIVNGKQWLASEDGDLEAYILKLKDELQRAANPNGDAPEDDPAEGEETE